MSRFGCLALAGALTLIGCKADEPTSDPARLRLARRPGGRVALELSGSAKAPSAVQVTLTSAGGTRRLDTPEPPAGVPLDTVRLEVRESDRFILFVGDKRGVALPQTGELASFAVTKVGSESAELSIASAVVVGRDGVAIPVDATSVLVLP